MINLTRLRLIRELSYRGTMTAVGTSLGLTSSAVSQQLSTFERELGVSLIERIGRRVRLTAEGVRLVTHSEDIFRAIEMAEDDLRRADDEPRGLVRVACFPSFAKATLLGAITRLQTRCPDIRVTIQELETPDALVAARDGECDLAITFTYNIVPSAVLYGLVPHLLLDEPVLLAMRKSLGRARDPIGLKRLAQEEWIVGSRQRDDHILAERACALAGFAPRIGHSVNDYDLVLQMIAAGLGVSFVPELALRHASAKAVAIRTPAGAPLRRRVSAYARSSQTNAPALNALLAELAT